MNHSVSALAHAFLAMIGISSSVIAASNSDFEWLLNHQPELATLASQELERRRADCSASTMHRLKLLRQKTLLSGAFVLAASIIGFLFVLVFGRVLFPMPNVLAVISIICFSWGTLGRLGWEGQSYGGQTIFEELDRFIFWSLYGAGTFFGTLAAFSGPPHV